MPKNPRSFRKRTSFNRQVNCITQELIRSLSASSNTQQLNVFLPGTEAPQVNSQQTDRHEASNDINICPVLSEPDTKSLSSSSQHSLFINNNVEETLSTPQNLESSSDGSLFGNLNTQIAGWAVQNRISGIAVGQLLNILKPYHKSLPCDPRTLLKTPKKILLKDIEPGQYYHIGIEQALKFVVLNSKEDIPHNICKVLINVDGLPISKSSSSQLYPILISLFPHNNIVSVIGLYHGYEKPKSANDFLRDFVEEAVYLTNNGFMCNEIIYQFEIKGFICDAPAKSFVKCIKGHTGYFSCTKCTQEGEFINNRMCFPEVDFIKRTDEDFINLKQEEHHTSLTILKEIPNLGLVSSFPLDYMHLHCLGVMKKLLVSLWINGKPPIKLPAKKIKNISNKLIMQSKNIPLEFCRKPRGLEEITRWKATELRQFLLYSGIVVLHGILPQNYYDNFLAFHLSTFILCNPQSDENQLNYAHALIIYFVNSFKILYGEDHIVHNVHNLLHVVDDVHIFGCLDNYSAFPFENYLQTLEKFIRKPNCPIQQVINRIYEFEAANKNILSKHLIIQGAQKSHSNGPLLENCVEPQYSEYQFQSFLLKSSFPNNICGLKNGIIIQIENFATQSNNIVIIGKKFKQIDNFFVTPCSSSNFNIFKIWDLEDNLCIWPIGYVERKFVKFDLPDDKFVVVPLLHSEKI